MAKNQRRRVPRPKTYSTGQLFFIILMMLMFLVMWAYNKKSPPKSKGSLATEKKPEIKKPLQKVKEVKQIKEHHSPKDQKELDDLLNKINKPETK